jgi:hypothetical protein
VVDAAAHPAASHYTHALQLGVEIVHTLAQPSSPEKLDRLDRLVAEREVEIAGAGEALGAAGAPEGLLPVLQALLDQQQAIEGEGTAALDALKREAQGTHSSRASLQGVQRLLDTSSRSRLFDVRG